MENYGTALDYAVKRFPPKLWNKEREGVDSAHAHILDCDLQQPLTKCRNRAEPQTLSGSYTATAEPLLLGRAEAL